MTKYNVHVYREMRLRFDSIEAHSQEEAAEIGRALSLKAADDFDECDGETFAALVDVDADDEFERSRVIDFEAERLRKTAPYLLASLQRAEFLLRRVADGDHLALAKLADAAEQARGAIIRATGKGACDGNV